MLFSKRMVTQYSIPACKSQASIMPCGFIVRFAPTNGFSTRKIARVQAAPEVLRAGSFFLRMAASLPRWLRKVLFARDQKARVFRGSAQADEETGSRIEPQARKLDTTTIIISV